MAILIVAVWFKPQLVASLAGLGIKPQLVFYSVWITGLVLSWRFNRSRILLALIILFLAYALIAKLTEITLIADTGVTSLIVGVLLSVNFLGIALLPEHGVMSRIGRTVAVVIFVETVLMLGLLHMSIFSHVVAQLQNIASMQWWSWTSLSTTTIVLALITLSTLCVRALIQYSAIEAGLLVAFASVIIGVHFIDGGQAESLFFVTAAIIMQATIIQDSHARVYRDELTGLPARRALDEKMMRLGKRYVLAMVDIDRFKEVNDNYGHQVGDQALRYIASHLSRVRGGAQVFRYGGEEFMLLFNGKKMEHVLPDIETFHKNIEKTPFILRGTARPEKKPKQTASSLSKTELALTVSIGVAERDKTNSTPEDVLKTADRRLYRAKEAGRNLVAAPRDKIKAMKK